MNQKEYYQILGIDKNARQEQIKQAYRKLAFQYHPDRDKNTPATNEKMKEINEAYATLSNTDKRREYDALREQYGHFAYDRYRQAHSSEDIFRGSDINQIFEEFARTFGFRSSDEIFKEFYGPGFQTFEFRNAGAFGKGFIFHNFSGETHEAMKTGEHRAQEYVPQVRHTGVLGRIVKYFLQKGLKMQFPEKGKDWWDVIALNPEQVQKGVEIEYPFRKWGGTKNLMIKIPAGIRDGQHN